MIKKTKDHEILTTFNLPGSERLLVGKYDIECTTLPRTVFRNVEILQSEVTHLKLEQPGVVNFVATSKGIGSIYEFDKEGKQRWIYNLNPNQTRNTVAIQPGNYKVVFRAETAKGSKFTTIKSFTIEPGSSFNIRL